MGKSQEQEPGNNSTKPFQTGHHDLRILNAIRQIIRAVDIDSRKLATEHKITGVPTENLIRPGSSGPDDLVMASVEVWTSDRNQRGCL